MNIPHKHPDITLRSVKVNHTLASFVGILCDLPGCVDPVHLDCTKLSILRKEVNPEGSLSMMHECSLVWSHCGIREAVQRTGSGALAEDQSSTYIRSSDEMLQIHSESCFQTVLTF